MRQVSGLILFAILTAVLIGCGQVIGCATVQSLLEKGYETPLAALYEQTSGGAYQRSSCQAMAFEKGSNDGMYRFITAAHCVATDDTFHERVVVSEKRYFIAFDNDETTTFFVVKVVAAGYQSRGDKYAVLEARLDKPVKLELDIAQTPAFKKFWSEFKDGNYKWFNPE